MAGPVVDPATIPIVVEDEGEHLHHGATPDELLAVLRRLPPGIVDGVHGIRLGLDAERRASGAAADENDAFDDEELYDVLPGIRTGRLLGWYCTSGDIYLCAYRVDAGWRDAPDARIKALYLTLRTLATLVHEVAHHHDVTARVARGRWLADDRDKAEIYAEAMEYRWVNEILVPYVEEARADDVAHLRAWLIRHGGADVPLGILLDDPRTTAPTAGPSIFQVRSALAQLIEDVAAGSDPVQTRLDFARELHYTEEYAIPRAILAGVLAEHPRHLEARTLVADLDVHEGLGAIAAQRCREVIADDPSWLDAWQVLVDALMLQRRWSDVVEATTRGVASAGVDGWLLRQRARAHLELGDDAALEADLVGLALGRRIGRWAQALRAMQLLRRGDLHGALAIAVPALAVRSPVAGLVLRAVRFDAAHGIGHPEFAGVLTNTDVDRLRADRHDAWADHLAAVIARTSA